MAKKGDVKNCRMLAKELIRSQRHKDRLYTSKAQMNSIIMQLEHQLGIIFLKAKTKDIFLILSLSSFQKKATLKVAGSLQKSGEVMKLVNQLAKLPEISQTMNQMSMEMTKVLYQKKRMYLCLLM